MFSISKIVLAALAVTSVMACVDETYGQGACDGEVASVDGNGAFVTQDTVNKMRDCFTAKYGPGPYTIDGVSFPDFGGLGNAWGIRFVDEANETFMMTIANNCGCTNTMDANIINTLFDEAGTGEHGTIEITCGLENCGGSELPSGMWAAVEHCSVPDSECAGRSYQRFEYC